MSRHPAVAAAAALTLVLAACSADPTAPTPRAPDAPSRLLVSLYGYQPAALPLDWGAAVNASNAVVGTLPNGQGVYYAQGTATPLQVVSSVTHVTPVDLTDDGRILARGDGPQGPKAFFYQSATTGAIDIAPGRWAEPYAMNNQGVAVGRFGPTPHGSWGAFRWTGGTGLVDVTPAGYELGWIIDVSESGSAIGFVQAGNAVSNFLWNPGSATGSVVPHSDAIEQALSGGALVGDPSLGTAIWTPTGAYHVGPAGYHAIKVTAAGRFIGSHTDAATGKSRVWTSFGSGGATTLPLPNGFDAAWAVDVNACGSILGRGSLTGTTTLRAIVWTRSFTCDVGPILTAQ